MYRRDCISRMLQLGAMAGIAGSWPDRLAQAMQASGRGKHLVVLWMPGGPSQMDTFDLKPGTTNGGPFQETSTNVPGLRFSEHLSQLSQFADHLAIIRSMQTKEGDHSRGTYLIRTGHRPGGPVQYPAITASLAKELSATDSAIPGYVSILPDVQINPSAFSAGFLGAAREPLTVGSNASQNTPQPTDEASGQPQEPASLRVDNLTAPMDLTRSRSQRRHEFWNMLQTSYGAASRGGAAATHDTAFRRALLLSESSLVQAFDLKQESATVRQQYGAHRFGQGCLMARRLIEHGVPVVEVALSDGPGGLAWDSHADNFNQVRRLSQLLDQSWSALMRDLKDRGLLEHTTIAWMGEFGRTPRINAQGGRDHFPNAWSCVLGGAGIQGGSIVGKTSEDGMEVVDQPVTAEDFLATLCRAVGVSPNSENFDDDQRPIKITEGTPIGSILTS